MKNLNKEKKISSSESLKWKFLSETLKLYQHELDLFADTYSDNRLGQRTSFTRTHLFT